MKSGTDSVVRQVKNLAILAGFIIESLSKILTDNQVRYWIEHKNDLKKKLCEIFSFTDEYDELRLDWQMFYKDNFGWDVDFSGVIILAKPNGEWRTLFIAKGLTCDNVYNSWKFKKIGLYPGIDKTISYNSRTASEHYVVWVHPENEPAKEFLGKSATKVDKDARIGITLLERMVYESKHFAETGEPLDTKRATLCSGSLRSDGKVPTVSWEPFDSTVYVYNTEDCPNPVCGIRRVVSV